MSLVALACDEAVVIARHEPAASEPGCADEGPHPYWSCVPDELPMHPACDIGCGSSSGSGVGYSWCGISCDSDLDCQPWAGESDARCTGVCHFHCDDEHPCPDDLECVDQNESGWGECLAAYVEPDE
ncbi:hypothetical protein ACNOYE_33350 [Nannocystaceae bacterium ST9]